MQVMKLEALDSTLRDEAVKIFIESFYTMFCGISKDKEVLRRLFAPCMRKDLFYVLVDGDCVAGLIAVSDMDKRAILIDPEVCISIFGPIKGKIMAWQLGKILGIPAVTDGQSGYIDFVATAPAYRKTGVATQLLTFMEAETQFKNLYLDVLVNNTPAVNLYRKLGYKVEKVKKNIWMQLAGIKAMNIMKKDLTNA